MKVHPDEKRLNKGAQIYQEVFEAEDLKTHHRLMTDFEYFARRCLWIKTQEGNLERFVFNEEQKYFHQQVEKMKAETGWVRIIVVKGRQQGISTYIEGRFFWIALTQEAKTISIISHDRDSVVELFAKAELFYKKLPEQFRLKRGIANRFEMNLENDSNYFIVTAGSGQAGRSKTCTHQHESERAWFEDASAIDAGAGQTIADLKGTEKFRESTGNGENHFCVEWRQAEAGEGDYRPVFIPWYWHKAYRKPLKPGFERTAYEEELVHLYGLDDEQLQWRRDKITFLKSEKLFKQEYPFVPEEAFQSSGDKFFDSEVITRARKRPTQKAYGPVILGVDVAGKGDRNIITVRQGKVVHAIIKLTPGEVAEKKEDIDDMFVAMKVAKAINEWQATKCFIDMGYGHGVVAILHSMGQAYRTIVQGVHFQETASEQIFANKRAQMYFELKDWLSGEDAKLPDDNDMAIELAAIPDSKFTQGGKHIFPMKEDIKEKTKRSPDIADSMVLTFAFPVLGREFTNAQESHKVNGGNSKPSPLTTLNNKPGYNSVRSNPRRR